jgi:hypothetical protein
MDLLNRLDVSIAGVVLVGVASASNDYYYYYQPGRVDAPKKTVESPASRNRAANGNGRAAAEVEMFVPEPASTDPQPD